MTAPLHRLARRLANVPKGNPRFVRGKATKAVHRSAGTLSGEFEIDGNNDTTTASLPFYASWIGSVLSSSLSEGQLEAFKGLYLNDAHATNATTTVSESITAAFAEAQRERDAAVSRVNTKVLFAKPSDEAKKLLDVWQRAEVRAGAFPILTLFTAPL